VKKTLFYFVTDDGKNTLGYFFRKV
jgi:hypothetical protein